MDDSQPPLLSNDGLESVHPQQEKENVCPNTPNEDDVTRMLLGDNLLAHLNFEQTNLNSN